MQPKLFRLFGLFILTASLLLSSCGFHLRGKIEVPESLKRIHIQGNDIELIERMGDGLAFSDIEIVEAGENVAILDMRNTSYAKEVNGTNSTGIANSYILSYAVIYEVFDPEAKSLQKHNLNQSRTLAYDAANVLLFEREEEFMREDMQKELVNQMLRRISKIK